jgi:hypothetical protein
MSTRSKSGNLDPGGRLLTTSALSEAVASKQFTIDVNTPNGRVELKTGEEGLRRREMLIRSRKPPMGALPTVYIGDSTVNAGNGYPLYLWDEIELSVGGSVGVYAFASVTGSEKACVHILEIE